MQIIVINELKDNDCNYILYFISKLKTVVVYLLHQKWNRWNESYRKIKKKIEIKI